MLGSILINGTHLGRKRQLTQILAAHGLGYVISALGLKRFGSLAGALVHLPHQTRPEHVRSALEEMGATFIKLGQILSTRADLLPPEYQAELTKLQDQAMPEDSNAIKACVEQELGCPVETAFASFDHIPIAAASIGQAHAARLHDGTEVVVKVRRPGVAEQVEEDLEILEALAVAAAARWELADRYDVVGLAQEFAQTLRAELDYTLEAGNAERFARNFEGDPSVHIPRVFWETTTSRILTLERIRGVKINELDSIDPNTVDRAALAASATGVILKMIFEDGFFHADPHPGNFFIERGGRLGLIDFGMVGYVDEATRENLSELLIAITSQDNERLVDVLLELGVARERIERSQLRQDLDHLLSRYYGRAIGEIRIGPLLTDVFAVVRKHHLHLPSNLALLLKTVVMAENSGALIDPHFHITSSIVPYAEQMMVDQYSPRLWGRKMSRAALDIARLGSDLPQHLRRLVSEIERGGLEIGMRPEGFEPVVQRLERLTNRLVIGMISAAFINGLAILVSVYRPPAWERWGWAAFAAGLGAVIALGVYLAWSILRPGRRK
ncbi:MAG TPA: AarF/ABC1/UbiB kinase family protein [Blastocatellia bacterium]|nr:AarF/ABC1/UbiB kinase family protein [Blastocatellia bacterium]